uniref:Uncharacterized protein n=1 Tax=Arundo donax TaxID=35708 RepID=A0A0A9G933_ARUDO
MASISPSVLKLLRTSTISRPISLGGAVAQR